MKVYPWKMYILLPLGMDLSLLRQMFLSAKSLVTQLMRVEWT
jgi:hypothetical protein